MEQRIAELALAKGRRGMVRIFLRSSKKSNREFCCIVHLNLRVDIPKQLK